MFAINVNNFELEESSTDQGINSQKLMQVHYHNVNCYNLQQNKIYINFPKPK